MSDILISSTGHQQKCHAYFGGVWLFPIGRHISVNLDQCPISLLKITVVDCYFKPSKSTVVERNFGLSKITVVDLNFGPSETTIVDRYFGHPKLRLWNISLDRS